MVRRQIHFFRVTLQRINPVTNTLQNVCNPGESIQQIFDHINNLPFDLNNPESRYMPVSDGNDLFMFVDCIHSPYKGRIVIARRNLLPVIESHGDLTPLDIPVNAGLAEITHFIYFTDNIIGVEFNFFGPRPTRISDYILNKSNEIINRMSLTPILQMNIEEQLQRIGEIALLEIEVDRNAIGIVNDLNESLGAAFQAAAEATEAEVLQIVLKRKPHARHGFTFPISQNRLIDIFRRAEVREMFRKFRAKATDVVTGETSKLFDFLADKLIISKTVDTVSNRSRTINTKRMYLAIEEAYNEVRDHFTIRMRGD